MPLRAPADQDAAAAGREGVWTLTAAPAVWALHFLSCYVLAAVWCARAGRDAPLGDARGWIGGLTLLALGVLALLAVRGWRRSRHAGGRSRSGDGAADRHRFLGWLALALASLAAVGVLYAATVVLLVEGCA